MKFSKKCLALLLSAALLMLPACGNGGSNQEASSSSAEEAENALDLEGSWVAEVQGNDYYLGGFIEDDIIELHWLSDYDQYGSVYWAGSYDAPQKDTEHYSWESERDDDIMATSGYTAADESRTFTYEDGKLILEASDLSYEVVLVPSDVDYTDLAVQVPGRDKHKDKHKDKEHKKTDAVKDKDDEKEEPVKKKNTDKAEKEKVKNIQLDNSGYAVETVGSGVSMIYYGVEISNPNKYNAILSPNVEITIRDEKGNLVSKQKKTLSGVAPESQVVFGDTIKCSNGNPAEVEIKVKNTDYDIVPYEGSGVYANTDLKVMHVKETSSDDKITFKGKIKNTTDYDIAKVLVSVVYYNNGEIVGGSTDYVNGIKANAEKDFSVANMTDFKGYDTYEVYAMPVSD